MKKIHGCVLLKETNTGIPNLVVAAFDSELRSPITRNESRMLTALAIDQLGKRIGSVLTDSDGKFLLTHEDLKFEGVESRPDLIIAVFAPEDVKDLKNPHPLSPEERLLYLSIVPRSDAGAEEAYIIRLLQSQLDKFGIPTVLTQENDAFSTRYFTSIENSYLFQENLNGLLSKRLRTQHVEAKKTKKLAKDKLNKFKVPPPLRAGDHQLPEKKDDDALMKIQSKVVQDGLKRMNKVKGTAFLTLNADQLKLMKLGFKGKKLTGQISSTNFASRIKQIMGGVDHVATNENHHIETAQKLHAKYSAEFLKDQRKKQTPASSGKTPAKAKTEQNTKSRSTEINLAEAFKRVRDKNFPKSVKDQKKTQAPVATGKAPAAAKPKQNPKSKSGGIRLIEAFKKLRDKHFPEPGKEPGKKKAPVKDRQASAKSKPKPKSRNNGKSTSK